MRDHVKTLFLALVADDLPPSGQFVRRVRVEWENPRDNRETVVREWHGEHAAAFVEETYPGRQDGNRTP